MASSLKDRCEIRCNADFYSSLEIGETQLGACESPRILSVLSSLLERIVIRNERLAASPSNQKICQKKLTIFHGLRAPNISIHNYIQRIFKYANCSPSCFVLAYAYIDKLTHQPSGAPINSLNVHRLVITSVMVAAKFLDDGHYNNAYYAKVGGVNTPEMNLLELKFLFNLNFRLHITVSTFESYCSQLEKEVALGGAGHKLERPLMYACSFDESSAQEKSQKQRVALPSTYSGV